MSSEAVKAGQIIADEFLRRIAKRYENCNLRIYPDMPTLTPVEAVLRCAQEEGFILTNVIPGGPIGGAGELTALVAKWRAYAASTFNYGSNIETRAIEGAWRMKAKECADELEAALAAAPPQPIETLVHQLTKVTLELEDTLASLGKADSMITKLKDLIAERDRHASAERVRQLAQSWSHDTFLKNEGTLDEKRMHTSSTCRRCQLERALPPSTGEKP